MWEKPMSAEATTLIQNASSFVSFTVTIFSSRPLPSGLRSV